MLKAVILMWTHNGVKHRACFVSHYKICKTNKTSLFQESVYAVKYALFEFESCLILSRSIEFD